MAADQDKFVGATKMEWADIGVLIGYFVVVLAFGLVVSTAFFLSHATLDSTRSCDVCRAAWRKQFHCARGEVVQ